MSKQRNPDEHLQRELTLLKATQAPMIFFEAAAPYAVREGIGSITLVAGQLVRIDNSITPDRRVVGFLKFPVSAIKSIREALDFIENAKPVPETAMN